MENKSTVTIAIFVLLIANVLAVPQVFMAYSQEQKYFFTLKIYLYNGGPAWAVKAAEIEKAEAAKIGINIEIETMDRAAWLPRITGTGTSSADGGYDIAPSSTDLAADPGIAFSVFHSRTLPPAGLNIVGINNGVIDALVDQGTAEMNETKRKEIYQKLLAVAEDLQNRIELDYGSRTLATRTYVQNVPLDFSRYFLRYAGYWTLSGKTAADDTTLKYGMQMTIVTLSPLFSVESGSVWTNNLATESLVQYNMVNKSIVPVLAKSWDISADGLNYTFYLRDNAYWHDGVKFTAEDVKFTYEAAADPNVGAWYKSQADNIKSIEIIDDYTIKFVMKTRNLASLPQLFSNQNGGGLVPKHIFDGVNRTDYKTHWSNTESIIGTGAYKFVQWVKGDYMEFEKNTQWWGGDPFIDHFFIKTIPDKTACITALKTSEVDVLDPLVSYEKEDIPALQADTNLNVQSSNYGGYDLFLLNGRGPILQNKYVRQALSVVFPREHFCTDILGLGSTPARELAAPVSWWYNPDLPAIDYNITKAQDLMVKAGYNYDWLAPTSVDTMTLYGIPIAGAAVGLGVGLPVGYLIKRRSKVKTA